LYLLHTSTTTRIYTLSLHDALPISLPHRGGRGAAGGGSQRVEPREPSGALLGVAHAAAPPGAPDELRSALVVPALPPADADDHRDRKSTRLNSSHVSISYAVFCLKK